MGGCHGGLHFHKSKGGSLRSSKTLLLPAGVSLCQTSCCASGIYRGEQFLGRRALLPRLLLDSHWKSELLLKRTCISFTGIPPSLTTKLHPVAKTDPIAFRTSTGKQVVNRSFPAESTSFEYRYQSQLPRKRPYSHRQTPSQEGTHAHAFSAPSQQPWSIRAVYSALSYKKQRKL